MDRICGRVLVQVVPPTKRDFVVAFGTGVRSDLACCAVYRQYEMCLRARVRSKCSRAFSFFPRSYFCLDSSSTSRISETRFRQSNSLLLLDIMQSLSRSL